MDGKPLILIDLTASLGMILEKQQSMPSYAGPVGPSEAETGDTGAIGQILNPGGVV